MDAAFAWMIARAGGGDFLVLRTTGTDAYDPYIYAMGGLNSGGKREREKERETDIAIKDWCRLDMLE